MTGIPDPLLDTPTHGDGGQSPGRLVRQARDRSKLSIEDLAAQIKLARYTLDAIERDDFAQLNEPVYVRGYYRKLAKVLPVTEAELLAAYEQMVGHKAPPHPSKLILAGGAELGSARRISLRLAATLVLGGLLIGALAFWSKNSQELPVVVSMPAESSAAPAESVLDAAIELPTPTADAAVSSLSQPAAEVSTGTVTPALSGSAQLQFTGTSWVEVKDATGKVLLSGLIEADNTQSTDGQLPLDVFLGNAPVVKITFNGQPVDLAPLIREDNTARITLQ